MAHAGIIGGGVDDGVPWTEPPFQPKFLRPLLGLVAIDQDHIFTLSKSSSNQDVKQCIREGEGSYSYYWSAK
jgi:hypothetical protein